MDDNILPQSFRKTVQFTTYDSYAPLVARFFEKPCKTGAVANLFYPGLPDCLCQSSLRRRVVFREYLSHIQPLLKN